MFRVLMSNSRRPPLVFGRPSMLVPVMDDEKIDVGPVILPSMASLKMTGTICGLLGLFAVALLGRRRAASKFS